VLYPIVILIFPLSILKINIFFFKKKKKMPSLSKVFGIAQCASMVNIVSIFAGFGFEKTSTAPNPMGRHSGCIGYRK
jgi:hypothetical protein